VGLTWEKKHKKCRVEFKARERNKESEGINQGKEMQRKVPARK